MCFPYLPLHCPPKVGTAGGGGSFLIDRVSIRYSVIIKNISLYISLWILRHSCGPYKSTQMTHCKIPLQCDASATLSYSSGIIDSMTYLFMPRLKPPRRTTVINPSFFNRSSERTTVLREIFRRLAMYVCTASGGRLAFGIPKQHQPHERPSVWLNDAAVKSTKPLSIAHRWPCEVRLDLAFLRTAALGVASGCSDVSSASIAGSTEQPGRILLLELSVIITPFWQLKVCSISVAALH